MRFCLAITAALLAILPARAEADKTKETFAVESLDLEWRDTKRNREVPAKLYLPKNSTNPCPVIVFSHGLGGTWNGYEYLGRHWASNGYAAVHLQHHGSDDAAWRGSARPLESVKAATLNVQNAIDRPLDVSFVLDQLTDFNGQGGALHHKLDLQRVGVAGHSFGAFTTLAIAGQRIGPRERSLADPRVQAAIAMSSPVPRRPSDRSYSQIKIPILHLTGTEDVSPINDTTAQDRRVPFDLISGAPQFLITFNGGDHMVFSGTSRGQRNAAQDAQMHDLILRSTTAFWDAYLRGDAKAKAWSTQEFSRALGTNGVFEQKSPRP
jgi:predicted dienelactone hydrolase